MIASFLFSASCSRVDHHSIFNWSLRLLVGFFIIMYWCKTYTGNNCAITILIAFSFKLNHSLLYFHYIILGILLVAENRKIPIFSKSAIDSSKTFDLPLLILYSIFELDLTCYFLFLTYLAKIKLVLYDLLQHIKMLPRLYR